MAHLPQLLSFVQCKPAYVFVLYMPVPILAGRCWLMDALRPVKRNQGVLIAKVKEVAADNTAQGVATLGERKNALVVRRNSWPDHNLHNNRRLSAL
jgi:hypothetical protein